MTGAGSAEPAATAIQPLAATEVMPRPGGTSGRSRALVIFGALCLVLLAGIAIAARDEPSGSELVAATDGSTATTVSEVAPTTPATPGTTTTTITPTTTTVAVTEPPPTTLPPVPDLMAGFPVPADLETFLAQLTPDPTLIGPRGVDVEHELARVLDQNSPKKRGDQARELIRHLEEWSAAGDVNPAVAEHLIAQLEPIASSDRPGDDDD